MKIKTLLLFLASFTNFAFAMNYSSMTAEELQAFLWRHIEEAPYEALPPMTGPTFAQGMKILTPSFNKQAFTGKECTLDREKIIHTFGTVIKVQLLAIQNEYSGILGNGAPFGLLRLSLAKPPEEEAYLPGFGLMIFVDRNAPLSVLAMPSLNPQKMPNLFTNDFTTAIPAPSFSVQGFFLNRAFTKGIAELGFTDHEPRALSNYHLTVINHDETPVSEVNTPYALVFRPTDDAKKLLEGIRPGDDFRSVLSASGLSKNLFDVYAKKFQDSPAVLIGRVVATSNFIASKFGDNLFFKHPSPLKKPKRRSCCLFW